MLFFADVFDLLSLSLTGLLLHILTFIVPFPATFTCFGPNSLFLLPLHTNNSDISLLRGSDLNVVEGAPMPLRSFAGGNSNQQAPSAATITTTGANKAAAAPPPAGAGTATAAPFLGLNVPGGYDEAADTYSQISRRHRFANNNNNNNAYGSSYQYASSVNSVATSGVSATGADVASSSQGVDERGERYAPSSPGSRGSRGSSGSLMSAAGNGYNNAGLGAGGGSRYGATASNGAGHQADQADSSELTVEQAAAPRYPSTEDLLRHLKLPPSSSHDHKNASSSGLPPSGRHNSSSRSSSRDAVVRTSPPVAEAGAAVAEPSAGNNSSSNSYKKYASSSSHPAPPIAIPVYGKGDKPVNIYGTLGTSGESSASLVQALTSLSKAPPPTGAQAARMTAAEEVLYIHALLVDWLFSICSLTHVSCRTPSCFSLNYRAFIFSRLHGSTLPSFTVIFAFRSLIIITQVAQLRAALAERDAALEQLTLERRTLALAHEEALREAEKAAYAAALRGEQLPRPSSPRLARAHARGHDQGARQAQADAADAAEVAAGAMAEVAGQSGSSSARRRLPVMLADGDFSAASPLPARSKSDHSLAQGARGRSRSPQQQQQQEQGYSSTGGASSLRRTSSSDRPHSLDSTESSSGKRVAMAAARGDEAAVEAEVEKLREEARQVVRTMMMACLHRLEMSQ